MQIVKRNPADYAGIIFEDDHNFLQLTVPLSPKGLLKRQKRLARIKRNLFRELAAFNKEMRRFPKESN
jgi:hypothetical protein